MNRAILIAIAALFVGAAALWSFWSLPDGSLRYLAIIGAAAAAYMALNVGANDVANNVGPAVGARAITMGSALTLAAVFEICGVIFAGNDVIATVSRDLLVWDTGFSDYTLMLAMIAALLAAALWINISTLFGAPVSTTHAIVGGIVGAFVAAAGPAAIAWPVVGTIAITWTISPLLGGILAAAIHAGIRRLITRRIDKVGAARLWVPLLVAAMAGLFAAYLATKLHPYGWRPEPPTTLGLGLVAAAIGWLVAMPWVRINSLTMENRKKQIGRLFRPPLIVAAALLSFAHGANDVANAIGPFTAILSAIGASANPVTGDAAPLWTLAIGALGIAFGLSLFGPRVIHTIGEQITKLNEIRAFCVALSAAGTVLLASAFGLPVSSTHVAVGAVFGVGFLREYLAMRNMQGAAPLHARFIDAASLNATPEEAIARERRHDRRYLVRRLKVARIAAAWVVTLPASTAMGAAFYWLASTIIA
ncbi:phosphate transporter [Devosia yakushimensis]|uniref:Phosphate transporter n=1 Tax=Devosia yakushimensis TaxID=470028 RepID=A0ABQ5UBU5_9HYPH|nr:inorganic phosphate transporter [Devosia yakushimensis]GLQ08916.1 phosphate transporter [Devosia yakushimensis]